MDKLKKSFSAEAEPAVRNRLFRAFALFGGLICLFVVLPVNVFLGLPWPASAGTVALGISALAAYAASLRNRYGFSFLFFMFLGLLDCFWFANAGSFGPTVIFFFIGAMFAVLFFQGRARLLMLGLFLANGIALHLIEHPLQRWIAPYPDPRGRTFAFLISFLIATSICVIAIWTVLSSYEREQEKLVQAGQALLEGEQRYARTFQCLPFGLAMADLETGRFLVLNEGFTDLFGFAAAEVIGRTSLELGIWPDPAIHGEVLARLRRGERVRGLPLQVRRKEGSLRWVSYSADQVVLDGQPCLLSGAVDITEQKAAEDQLRENEARFRMITENAADVVSLVELGTLRYLYLNPMAARFSGHSLAEMRSMSFRDAFTPESLAMCLEHLAAQVEAFAGGDESARTWKLELDHVRKDGRIIPAEVTLSLIRDEDGKARRLLALTHDITERRWAEEERLSMEAQLQHLLRMESVGRLAGGIAHDMNNVLAAIMAVSQLMQRRGGEDARQAELIFEATKRGRDLVKGLMEFARKEVQDAETLDLNELVHKEAELLSSTTLKRVKLELELAPGLPRMVGSATALSTALMNLCVNAVDAMPEGGTLRMRTARLEDGSLELAVEDSGHGMPPEVLSRAMEPFFTTKPVGKGTGLGLSMVFGTVQAHGGSMEIQSEMDVGTRVRIRLPLAPGRLLLEHRPAIDSAAPGSPRLRILLVDDDPLVRETAQSMLESLGHAVKAAAGGYEALGLALQGGAWDAVVLDLNMPDLDGIETLRQVRRLHPALPALLTTGFAEAGVAERLAPLGPAALLLKPYTAREIQEALAGLAANSLGF